MPYKDPIKQKEYQDKYNKEHYVKNKEGYLKRNKIRGDRNVQWLSEYRNGLVCEKCGYSDSRALEFHHKIPVRSSDNGLRVANIARRSGWTIERLKSYIEATFIVLCANCHRIEHYEERKDYQ